MKFCLPPNPLWPSLRSRVVLLRRSEGHALFHCGTPSSPDRNHFGKPTLLSLSNQLWSGENTWATITVVHDYGKWGLSVNNVGPNSSDVSGLV